MDSRDSSGWYILTQDSGRDRASAAAVCRRPFATREAAATHLQSRFPAAQLVHETWRLYRVPVGQDGVLLAVAYLPGAQYSTVNYGLN
jgi:hypothetical protein